MIRLVRLLKRAPQISAEQFTDRWRDAHGPLVASAQAKINILRYVQTHHTQGADKIELDASRARGGVLPPYDGIEEFWWRSEADFEAALSNVGGAAAYSSILESARVFANLDASPMWFAHEYPQVSAVLGAIVATPKSGIVKLNFSIAPHSGMSIDAAKRYWLTEHGPLVRSHARARGTLVYNQVHRCDAVNQRLTDSHHGAPASCFMGHAEAWFDRTNPQAGPEVDAAKTAAIADEEKFIDWSRSTIFVGKELVFVDRNWM